MFFLDNKKTQGDLWILPLLGDRKPFPILQSSYSEANGEFSNDGKWIAYDSDESGKTEVYVRPFPDVQSGKWQVSSGGGTLPRWRRDGKELFYVSADADLMAVDISTVSGFQAGLPKRLFSLPTMCLRLIPFTTFLRTVSGLWFLPLPEFTILQRSTFLPIG